MNKPRQRRHQFYYERLKVENKFKQAAKALPINIDRLTKGKSNARTHNTTNDWRSDWASYDADREVGAEKKAKCGKWC